MFGQAIKRDDSDSIVSIVVELLPVISLITFTIITIM